MAKKVNNSKMKYVVSFIITMIVCAIVYYMAFPALTPISIGFWVIIVGVSIFYGVVYSVSTIIFESATVVNDAKKMDIPLAICIFTSGISILVLLVGGIASSKIFRSSTYANVLNIEESKFEDEIEKTESVSDIALMDSASAAIIGERAMGELTDLVSQFEVSKKYSQIDYNGKPMKVAPLEYAGLIKWFNNKSEGIPGYILVDPIDNTAKYVKTEKPIEYSPSSYFGKNLYRHLQMSYPTKLFGECYFEIDNEGKPYWICPVMKHNAGLFGAQDVKGCVVMDASSGECEYYDVKNVPTWVDVVYNGDLIQEQYNWYGYLNGGFINSIIGNKGCKVTTDDYGYKVMDGDVWIYTGITSVNGDQSNIGFILVNSRTAQCKYFNVSGAEEHSAMSAAEGEVQNLGYDASFPSLINILGEPTYIMVLKDDGGLVKQYAFVNVKKYNVVTTATTQKDALNQYKKLMKENGIISSKIKTDDEKTATIVVEDIKFILVDQETIVYITAQDGRVFKQNFAENELLIKIKPEDNITVTYEKEDDIIDIITCEVNK